MSMFTSLFISMFMQNKHEHERVQKYVHLPVLVHERTTVNKKSTYVDVDKDVDIDMDMNMNMNRNINIT
jgi:hypothetical protein